MPFYDRLCGACRWQGIDLFEPIAAGNVACPVCGSLTERAWLSKAASVNADECDFIQHNGTREPIRFRSKELFRKWLKAEGYRVNDTHVGKPGSDKSPHSSSCSAVTAETLAGAKAMLERVGATRHDGEIGITSSEGLVRYMRDKGRAERGHYFQP